MTIDGEAMGYDMCSLVSPRMHSTTRAVLVGNAPVHKSNNQLKEDLSILSLPFGVRHVYTKLSRIDAINCGTHEIHIIARGH